MRCVVYLKDIDRAKYFYAGAYYLLEYAKGFEQAGCEVAVVTPSSETESGKQDEYI